jgi:P-type conjugative transfer protein TrbJ
MSRLRQLATASLIAIAALHTPMPATAQWIVFDPNNYAQNVLTAARELQQINNQITSLQNQAQMLINQARNLANLPFSSLQQLEQSIQRTQQLLTQAQRIAYDVQQIDRAFSTTYAPASSSQSDQALIGNAQVRWQNAVAGLQDAMARVVFESFAGLGLKASGTGLSSADFLRPGRIAQVGIDAGRPILDSISGLMGYISFFENFVQIVILLFAWG